MTAKEAETLCEDCPPVGYPTDETRCLPCPRRAKSMAASPPKPTGDGLVDREVIALDVNAAVSFVDHGPMCRECADEDGICPSTHLPCGDADRAIRYVVERINYGLANGFITLLGGRSGNTSSAAGSSRGFVAPTDDLHTAGKED